MIVLGLGVIGVLVFVSQCPCGPMPGAWLVGEEADAPVSDWSFVNDREAVPLCQLQVTTWRPHSINLNCMSEGGRLFVSCSNCADKRWSNDALTHPNGHLRAGSLVYPVEMRRVVADEQLDSAWAARLRKVGGDPSPRPDHWWSFELTSRAGAG